MADSKLTTTQQLESMWSLGGLTLKELVKRVWAGINENDLLSRASELAYNFILALFPLLLFLVSVFGLFASHGKLLSSNLMNYLADVLPPSAFEIVNRTIMEVSRNSGGAKVTFGIVLTLWFASGGMVSMMSTLNAAYAVRETRSYFKVRAIALGLTIAVSILVIMALGVVLLGGYLAELAGSELHLGAFAILAWKVLQWPMALAFVVLSFSLIYYFGPDLKEQHWYWITPGSLVGVLLWLAASFAFRAYLHFFNTYSKTYGSLGAVIILLVWFYVTGLAFLVGGEINAQIEHAAAEHGHPEAKAPGQKAA
ncbi:MAG: putative rane protein [Acidobacteriaceae bacterium]|nr:putative rane protein [Acidobacteriaceae bacterium]